MKGEVIEQPADMSRQQWVEMLNRDYEVYTRVIAWARRNRQRRPFAFQCERDIKATLKALGEPLPKIGNPA